MLPFVPRPWHQFRAGREAQVRHLQRPAADPELGPRRAALRPRLVMQLCGLERRTARGGRDSIDHGPGGHDDVANACAGALVRTVGEHAGMEVWRRLGGGTPQPAVPSGRWESRWRDGRPRNWDHEHGCWYGEHPSHKELA
jgi:hypothetical protein